MVLSDFLSLKSRVISLDSLKDKTDSELNRLLLQAPRLSSLQRQEDLRRYYIPIRYSK